MQRIGLVLLGLFGLAACEPIPGQPISNLPEAVTAIAAPTQNLATARLLEDNCFWYEYAGPVETTLLPLVTTDGRPICTQPPAEAASS